MPREKGVPSQQISQDEVNSICSGCDLPMAEQVQSLSDSQIQQSINCCGLTSVAYALTALGCETTVDDLFLDVAIDVESAVGDGMTLAEIHDATSRYVRHKELPVFVECYHFDKGAATAESFQKAVHADAAEGVDDLLVMNFHSGIAHGWESGGGGHFSILLGERPDSTTNELIVADVHAMKYGAYWSAPSDQLYAAMADHDSCGRARGLLRFGRADKDVKRPLPGMKPTLVEWATSNDSDELVRYIPEWDEGLGARNMEGVSALSAAMCVLEGADSPAATLDGLMRSLRESYTHHLNTFAKPQDVYRMAAALKEKDITEAKAELVTLSVGCKGPELKEKLIQVGCGKKEAVVLACFDINVAKGFQLVKPSKSEAGALEHGVKTWSLLASVKEDLASDDENSLVVAPAHNIILAGRLWSVSVDSMANAIATLADGKESSIVVITKH